ncbi:MAG: MBL fold metallo-hydrolase [Planctomycetes bacterium]|nr:MBL fold metallo-hydrolase [Planctomycetota bacterium]
MQTSTDSADNDNASTAVFPFTRSREDDHNAVKFVYETRQLPSSLVDSLASPPAEPGTLRIHWLGQAGFALQSDKQLVVVDPYLSDALAVKYRGKLFTHQRMMAPPMSVDAAVGAKYLLSTHAHSDHLDPDMVGPFMQANPGCILICPASAREKALERGAPPDRIEYMEPGMRKVDDGFTVEAIASAHETVDYNDRGEHLYLGYVMEMAGLRIYHSGDCIPYDGLAVELAKRRIDVALLPVNGRDEFRTSRGVAGNFTIHEAARLCFTTGIGFLVPHHFGMFDFNTVNEDEIQQRLDGCHGLDYWLPTLDSMLILKSVQRADSRRISM